MANKNYLCELQFLPKSPLFEFLNQNFLVNSIDNNILSLCGERRISLKNQSKKLNVFEQRLNFILKTIENEFKILKNYFEVNEPKFEEKIFIMYLDEYFEHASAKLKENQSTVLKKSIIIDKLSNENEANILKINRSKFLLAKKISEFNEKCNFKERKIANIILQKQKAKEKSALKILDETYDGNIKIKKLKSRCEIEQKLMIEYKTSKNKFQNLVDNNVIIQRRLIDQKLKAEQALEAILLKFDNDIGSRVSDMESIKGHMNEEKQKFEEWKSTIFEQQEAYHEKLIQEIEEEERIYREQKLEEIRSRHAAKVIQSGWRKYKIKQKKAMKKNKKKDVPKRSK